MADKKAELRFSQIMAAAFLMVCGPVPAALADAQPTYDRRIEEAAIRMLQPKLGDIRGSLDLDIDGHLFPPLSRRVVEQDRPDVPASRSGGQIDGSFIRY